MKYLKVFENYTSKKELQDFCNNYLAYLIDSGVKVIVKGEYAFSIFIGNLNISFEDSINFNHSKNTIGLNWSDIKDDIIPFTIMLKDKYNIEYIRFRKLNNVNASRYSSEKFEGESYDIELDDIIKDKVSDIDNIYYIRIDVS